jgi:small neutral amino acid transporter SnatA (MarC family)
VLLLVLAGVLSLGTITAVLTGNALPIAGGAVVVLVAAAALHRRRSRPPPPDGDDLGEESQTDRRTRIAPDV